MTINNNLYPPLVDTYLPAFIVGETCRVYFSLSEFNNISEIANAQVIVSSQYTNASVLDAGEEKYPSEIMLKEIMTNEDLSMSPHTHYIEILNSDIDGGFEIDMYYKVQIRFTGSNASEIGLSTPQKIDSWLVANLGYFSEWSTVLLIRAISQPTIELLGLPEDNGSATLSNTNVIVNGQLIFEDEQETEILNYYQVLVEDDSNAQVYNSGVVYSTTYNNPNMIYHSIKYNFKDGETYTIKIPYTTQNLYEDEYTATLTFNEEAAAADTFTLEMNYDREEATVQLTVSGEGVTGKNFYIKRTSNLTNYTIWEELFNTTVTDEAYSWFDNTVESGIVYKYKVHTEGAKGFETEPYLVTFDHLYLCGNSEQLRVEFNPAISSFKYMVSEAKVDTIGSQFPFITKNGDMFYRQIPIAGMISSLMDSNSTFYSREKAFGDSLNLYDEFNLTNRVSEGYDIIYERKFREKVMSFLHRNEIKLLRTPTEGNVIVKLMDVNFTPQQNLGRMLYSFSCNAYEIDIDAVETYQKYNIITKGKFN